MIEGLITLWNVLLVLLGFGFVIFIHELGHFVAARWAGIRVHEFAIGFGPAACAFRKGIGLRRGSTNAEYERMKRASGDPDHVDGVSDTEYRLNWFPLGGYVRMLGQEDANPGATSAAPDSYTSVPVWKRMIVVSAGVVMNVILAAILFVVVYAVGLESNAPAVQLPEDSAAYKGGLRTGDVVRTVNGHDVEVFQDIVLKVGLSKKGEPLEIVAQRPGVGTIEASVEPEYDASMQIRAIGAFALPEATIKTPPTEERALLERRLGLFGLDGVSAGMRLVEVDGAPVEAVDVEPWGAVALPTMLLDAAASSGGEAFPVVFADASGVRVEAMFEPMAELTMSLARVGPDDVRAVEHVLGLTPVMRARTVEERAASFGLRAGDVFARLGSERWPSVIEGVRAIRAASGGAIGATVLRDGAFVELELGVSDAGTVGFLPEGATDLPYLADPPTPVAASDGEEATPLAVRTLSAPVGSGMMLVEVDGVPVASLVDARDALIEATREASAGASGATVDIVVRALEPGSATTGPVRTLAWELGAADVERLHDLGWTAEPALALFAPARVLMVGSNPADSVMLGLRETQRMLTRVYLTLGRLADGSVKPQQLKGPVGITHIGSRVAREGLIRLLFFIGLISANLAVLNFLPLPIVDGGLFLMLVYEGIFKKPVPVGVQNALTVVGLVLIASVFLFVTANDLLSLFG